MKILGIDPGYERLGVAVIDHPTPDAGYGVAQKKDIVAFSGCIRTSAKLDMPDRLLQLGKELSEVIEKYKPDAVAIETLYFAKNTKTAMAVAEARGVIQYVTRLAGIPIFEYHPNAIKIAVTGHGGADKAAIALMIPRIIELNSSKKIDDELDAIAVALCHLAHRSNAYPQVGK